MSLVKSMLSLLYASIAIVLYYGFVIGVFEYVYTFEGYINYVLICAIMLFILQASNYIKGIDKLILSKTLICCNDYKKTQYILRTMSILMCLCSIIYVWWRDFAIVYSILVTVELAFLCDIGRDSIKEDDRFMK